MNSLQKDLVKRIVILDPEYNEGASDLDRAYLVAGGFGSRPNSNGHIAYGMYLLERRSEVIDTTTILREATHEEIQEILQRCPWLDASKILIPPKE